MDDDDLEPRGFGAGDWLKAIGGLVFFIAGLLPWWSYTFESPAGSLHYDDNAFDFALDGVVPYVIFVAIAVVTIVSQTGSLRLPAFLVHPLLHAGGRRHRDRPGRLPLLRRRVRRRIARPRDVPRARRRGARARRMRDRLPRRPGELLRRRRRAARRSCRRTDDSTAPRRRCPDRVDVSRFKTGDWLLVSGGGGDARRGADPGLGDGRLRARQRRPPQRLRLPGDRWARVGVDRGRRRPRLPPGQRADAAGTRPVAGAVARRDRPGDDPDGAAR